MLYYICLIRLISSYNAMCIYIYIYVIHITIWFIFSTLSFGAAANQHSKPRSPISVVFGASVSLLSLPCLNVDLWLSSLVHDYCL